MTEFKFFCPQCGQHIQCDTSYAGQQINCPICQQSIIVPQPPHAVSAVSPPVAANSRVLRNVLVAVAVIIIFTGLVIGGWYVYSKIKLHNRIGNLPSGLVALWSGEGNGKDSVGGNNGELHGGVNFKSGKVGQAFAFDGINAYVEVPSSRAITPVGTFTVTAWVNYLHMSQPSGVVVLAKGEDAHTSVDWALAISTIHKLRPHADVGGKWVYFDCASTLKPHVWYHVAMVYDGTSLRGYVNGELDGTQVVSGELQSTDNSLKIGSYAPVNGMESKCFFPGLIDELAIYNRALSAEEIREIYTKQK